MEVKEGSIQGKKVQREKENQMKGNDPTSTQPATQSAQDNATGSIFCGTLLVMAGANGFCLETLPPVAAG